MPEAGADPIASPDTPRDSTDAWLASQTPEFLRNNEDLLDFNSWIVAQGAFDQGMVDNRNDTYKRTKEVLWYGDSPMISKIAREGERRGIAVSVRQSRYSFNQARDASAKLMSSAPEINNHHKFNLQAVVLENFEFSGLTIEGYWQTTPSDIETAIKEIEAEATLATGVEVRVKMATPIMAAGVTRSNDYEPFNAGGYMTGCSSGFGVHLTMTNRTYTTTARHCRTYPYKARDNSARVYGSVFIDVTAAQASLLSAKGSSWVFDGAHNNAAGYKKQVQQGTYVFQGDSVCTSGGNSGVHCSIVVNNSAVQWNDGHGSELNVRATQQQGTIALIQGDSGGPVIVPFTNGLVAAAGTIQAVADGISNCGSVRDPGTCGKTVLFTRIGTLLDGLSSQGGTLVTVYTS